MAKSENDLQNLNSRIFVQPEGIAMNTTGLIRYIMHLEIREPNYCLI